MGFGAVVVTAGAQGTKKLGIEGEEAVGVYHAKDVVYHLQFVATLQPSATLKSAVASPSSAWATSWSISPTGCSI